MGQRRRKKTQTDTGGYDRVTVQKAVNTLLSGKITKTVDEVAREVISGKWGNGEDRTKRLKDARYDPMDVQKKVNQLLR